VSTGGGRAAGLAARHTRLAAAAAGAGLSAVVGAGSGLLKHHGFLDWLVGVAPPLRPMYALLGPDAEVTAVVASEADAELVRRRAPGASPHVAAGGGAALAAAAGSLAAARAPRWSRVGVVSLGALPGDERAALADRLPHAELVDATALVAAEKAVKDPDELDELRCAAAVADEAFERLLESARPGTTEAEVAAEATAAAIRLGARQAVVFVGGGLHPGLPPSRTPLPEDSPVTVYVEVCGENGYWVEAIGVLWLGRRPGRPRLGRPVSTAEAALAAGERALGSGATGGDVAEAMTAVAAAGGAAIGTSHSLGHGVGAGDDDLPAIRVGGRGRISPGMVVVLHPNVVDAEAGVSVTVGGTYVVGEGRPERLSRLPLVAERT